MTDYNDGKWHGWNGGKCPVHPNSMVDVRFLNRMPYKPRPAQEWLWDHDGNIGDIIAFRVVKANTETHEYTIDPNKYFIWYSCEDVLVHVREASK